MFERSSRERFKRALNDPLTANVDPRPGGHLPVHRKSHSLESVKLIPVRPLPNEVCVSDQHSRRVLVSAEDAHRLARLNQQRFIVFKVAQRTHNRIKAPPVTGCLSGAPVDDQLTGLLRNLGVEVVH